MVNNNRIGINNVSTIQKNAYGNNINQYILVPVSLLIVVIITLFSLKGLILLE